jgi:hypothetical protein
MVAELQGDPRRPRRGQTVSQGLRAISHLYLSSSSRQPPPPVTRNRRTLRLGLSGDRLAKVEVCGNLAVQMARLGLRTLVLDLDPMLPNAGFHLGLEPAVYLAHLRPDPHPVLERGVLGLRVLEGIAAEVPPPLSATLEQEVRGSDCVLVNLPGGVTMASAVGPIGAWLAQRMNGSSSRTAERENPGRENPGRAQPSPAVDRATLDAVLVVRGPGSAENGPDGCEALTHGRVHWVDWGEATSPRTPPPWARIRPGPLGLGSRQPLSALDPEHPAARLYEGLAQSLLAACGSRGGGGG